MKYFLLIQSFKDISDVNDDRICRFIVFSEDNTEHVNLLNYYKECIYQLNKNQYEHIRYYNNRQDTFSNLNKKDFFIQNDIEELLI